MLAMWQELLQLSHHNHLVRLSTLITPSALHIAAYYSSTFLFLSESIGLMVAWLGG